MKKKLGIRFEVIPASYKNVNLISVKETMKNRICETRIFENV